jgi:hypothetical protein
LTVWLELALERPLLSCVCSLPARTDHTACKILHYTNLSHGIRIRICHMRFCPSAHQQLSMIIGIYRYRQVSNLNHRYIDIYRCIDEIQYKSILDSFEASASHARAARTRRSALYCTSATHAYTYRSVPLSGHVHASMALLLRGVKATQDRYFRFVRAPVRPTPR